MNSDIKLILASASPRRSDILNSLGIEFSVVVSDAEECSDSDDAGQHVEDIAMCKCMAVVASLIDEKKMTDEMMILAADTLVVCDGEFLGKPENAEDAARMLKMLSGRSHSVLTGIALWHKGICVTEHESTEVVFDELTDKEINSYIESGEPFGKAGAYAIQGIGSRYIREIHGDYFNVVGLPAHKLYRTVLDTFSITL